MAGDPGIAHKIESMAYDVIYLLFGIGFTFWDFLFRPSVFKRLSGIAKTETEVAQVRSPYALPITYAAVAVVVFFIYVPAIVGYRPADYPMLGPAMDERIGFLNSITSAVKSARLSQILMMVVPFVALIALHAAFVRLFLGGLRLKTKFETQLGLNCYTTGTLLILACIFMSPELFHVPVRALSLNRGSVGSEDWFLAVLAMAIAFIVLTVFRYITFVNHSCHAAPVQLWRTALAILEATALTAGTMWLLFYLWLPFAFS